MVSQICLSVYFQANLKMKLCKEKKQYLSGKVITYNCKLVTLCSQYGILKYVVGRQYQVGSLRLEPGTVTYGFYWQDRTYVLYKWFDQNKDVLGDYFNIADSIELSEREFSWRDLVIDILVHSTGKVEILDEDEMPERIDESLKCYIESSKKTVLQNYKKVIAETNTILNQSSY